MRKFWMNSIPVLCLIFFLTGCIADNKNEETKNNENIFCQTKAVTINGTETSRQYFAYPGGTDSTNCSNFYLGSNGKLRYGDSSSSDEYITEFNSFDLDSFRALTPNVGIDKAAFYSRWSRELYDPLDRNTLVVINSSYLRDNKAVYRISDSDIQIIHNLDPATFELVDSECSYTCYTKDKNGIYYEGEKVPEADRNSFTTKNISGEYGRFGQDRKHLYYNGNLVEEADPNTFIDIDTHRNFFRDKDSVFYRVTEFAPPVKITGSDANSFEFLANGFEKDKNQVYFNGEVIEGADPATFEIEDGEYFAKDKNSLYVGTQKRDKKSVVKNYIEAYFKNNKSGRYYDSFNTDINKEGHNLSIVLQFSNGIDISPFWFFAEGSCPSYYLPRKDEEIFRDLENKLNQKFNIDKINISYRDFENKIIEVYSDHQYVYEDIFMGLSEDGRYAELSFDFDGLRNEFGLLYDMYTGESVGYTGDKEKHIYCGGSNGCGPEWSTEGCQKNIEQEKEELLIQPVMDFENIYYKDTVELDDSIRVISKEFNYPEGSKTPEGYEMDGFENMININLVHVPTNTEHTIMTIDEPKCGLAPIGFYGHKKMEGLFFIYIDQGCYWQNPHVQIISQDNLDQKLAELYNNVGMYYYNEKDHKTAITYFDKATSIQNDYGQAYYNKACTHSLMKHSDAAISSLKIAIRLEPEKFKEKAKTDKDFDSIKNLPQFIDLLD